MPVILATWQAEIGRIVVRGQKGEKKTVRLPHGKKLDMVAHACHSNYSRKPKIGSVRTGLHKNRDPISQITRAKMAGGVVRLAWTT
jgi:hypothetical protein